MTSPVLLEVCVDSLDGALAAFRGGADRVELCSSLGEGGLTPSHGLIKLVRSAITSPLIVIIRPRGGDFLYSPSDLSVMKQDITAASEAGADGIALGLLTYDGEVDIYQLKLMADLARMKGLQTTFHRAFDFVLDQSQGLDALIVCGIQRVLTSGRRGSAQEGAFQIANLVKHANGRIIVMAGGGIRSHNVLQVCQATGVTEIHSSASRQHESGMQWRMPAMSLSTSRTESDWQWSVTDEETVKSLADTLQSAMRSGNQ